MSVYHFARLSGIHDIEGSTWVYLNRVNFLPTARSRSKTRTPEPDQDAKGSRTGKSASAKAKTAPKRKPAHVSEVTLPPRKRARGKQQES